MSLQNKRQVGVTGCQLDAWNKDCIALVSTHQDCCLDAVQLLCICMTFNLVPLQRPCRRGASDSRLEVKAACEGAAVCLEVVEVVVVVLFTSQCQRPPS